VIVDNAHRGSNATMYSNPKEAGGKDGKNPQGRDAKPSPDEEVLEFLKKIDFRNKDWTFVIHKHDGWRGVHHIRKDGSYEFYDLSSGNHIDTNRWTLEGATY